MSSQYENGSSKRLSMDELTRMNAPQIPRSTSQDEVLKRLESMNAALTNTLREQSKEIAELKSRLDKLTDQQDGNRSAEPLRENEFRELRLSVMRSSKTSETTSQNAFWLMLACAGLNILTFSAVCFLVLR